MKNDKKEGWFAGAGVGVLAVGRASVGCGGAGAWLVDVGTGVGG
jgi:hypothetical protein